MTVERLCLASGVRRPESEMIRFALDSEGRVSADLRRRLPGRGAWVRARRSAVATATAKGAFSRGFGGRRAKASADLADRVEALLRDRALSSLGLARRAGGLRLGATATESALASGEALGFFVAVDSEASESSRRSVRRWLERGARRLEIPFASVELERALGRSPIVYGAALRGSAGTSFVAALERWRDYVREDREDDVS